MRTLYVRNVPQSLNDALRELVRVNHRSLLV
jgi:hypothetical protein